MYPIKENVDIWGTVRGIIPEWEEIPEKFKNARSKWHKLVEDWLFLGLSELNLTPREEVDEKKALRHISCIMRSFEPKHEHKKAAVAYLLDQWFSDGSWKARPRK